MWLGIAAVPDNLTKRPQQKPEISAGHPITKANYGGNYERKETLQAAPY